MNNGMRMLVLAALVFGGGICCGAEIRYPADSGIVDVTQPPYNAKGDGVTDDTAAINAALRDWNNARLPNNAMTATIYFPKGTYLISDTLIPMDPNGKNDQSNVRFLGESREETVIKLKDACEGFQKFGKPKFVVKTGNQPRSSVAVVGGLPNMGFGNYIQNLTIDSGTGNPGAVGVRYDVANWGAMEHVTIRSGDGQGHSGLRFYSVCGTGFVKDVRIEGFAYGIYFDATAVNNIVFEHITLEGQSMCGIYNQGKNIQVRGLTFRGNVPALRSKNPWAATVLVEADLRAPVGTLCAAIEVQDEGFLYARDVVSSGYSSVMAGADGARIHEGCSHAAGGRMSLRLPIEESPEYHNNDFSTWASVVAFGATPNDDSDDDGPAIQAAIDSGKETVYFPLGEYHINSSLIVRGAVKKIDGMFSRVIRAEGNETAEIHITDVAGDLFVLENIATERIPTVYNSADTLVIRHRPKRGKIRCGPNASGKLFVEDVGPHTDVHVSGGIQVWMRQVNREVEGFVNDGCTVWYFGDNVERMFVHSLGRLEKKSFLTVNGGRSEILGGALDVLAYRHAPDSVALFKVVDSDMSVVFAGEIRAKDGTSGTWGRLISAKQGGREQVISQPESLMVPRGRAGTFRFVAGPYRSMRK